MKITKITIGNLKTHKALLSALEKKNIKVDSWGKKILKKIPLAKKKETLEVEIKSVEDLGFPNGATRKDIYDRAITMGLELCPAEIGPQMALQYDQPIYEWIRVAMEPITGSLGPLLVFRLAHDVGDQWLRGYAGHPDYFWHGDSRWVFVRRK